MVKTKKVLAVVLSVILLFSCFVVGSSALTYSPSNTTGEFKVITTADKTTVAPGDVVVFSVAIDPGTKSDIGASNTVITYNGNQVTPCDVNGNATTNNQAFRTWQNSCAEWTKPTGTCNFNYAISQLTPNFTEEEKAYYTKNVFIAGQVYSDNGATNIAGNGWNPTAGEVYVTFQMKVADTVQPGDEIWVGLHEASFLKGTSYFMACGGSRYSNDVYDLTNSMVKLTVAGDTKASFVQYSKAQIRFAGIGATSAAADYKGTFDVRTVAKISQADFLANFTDEATAKEKITDVGFVYATAANVADFNLDTAKAVAEGTAADGYVKKAVSYIQHTGDGADYIFTCLIENIADADKDQTVNCLGYVCFDGTYYYFDAAATVSFNNLYTTYFPAA